MTLSIQNESRLLFYMLQRMAKQIHEYIAWKLSKDESLEVKYFCF